MQKPDTIFFDLDETLIENKVSMNEIYAETYYHFRSEIGKKNKRKFFYILRDNAKRLWRNMFDFQTSPETLMVACFRNSVAELNQHSLEVCNNLANRMYRHFLKLTADQIELHHDSLETLAKLSELGFTTGILTNGVEEVQHGKLQKLDLYSKVDHVIISAQARSHKPNLGAFNYALQRAGTTFDQAWMVGDHPKNDIMGALNAGITAVFYNPNQHSVKKAFELYGEKPNYTIERLSQTIELLQ